MSAFFENIIQVLAGWCTVVVRSLGMLPSVLAMANDITTIYYFPIDHEGNETGEAIPVTLKPDGTADVSQLPIKTKERFESFGVSDLSRTHYYFPKDGRAFLQALLHIKNGYTRFRVNPNLTKKSV